MRLAACRTPRLGVRLPGIDAVINLPLNIVTLREIPKAGLRADGCLAKCDELGVLDLLVFLVAPLHKQRSRQCAKNPP